MCVCVCVCLCMCVLTQRLQEWLEEAAGSSTVRSALSGLSSSVLIPTAARHGKASGPAVTLMLPKVPGTGRGGGHTHTAADKVASGGVSGAAHGGGNVGSDACVDVRWCTLAHLDCMKCASLARRLFATIELQLTANRLLTPLVDMEMPLVSAHAATPYP